MISPAAFSADFIGVHPYDELPKGSFWFIFKKTIDFFIFLFYNYK